MANDVQYLIDMLYEMIDGADTVPWSRGKCMLVRDDALELLDELKGQLPAELDKAQKLLRRKDEFIEKAKKEAEQIRRQAEMDARATVDESEVLRIARDKGQQIIRQARDRANGMISVANEYTDDALGRTEEAIQMALQEIRDSRARFRAVSNEKLQTQRARLEEQRNDYDGGR